MRRCAIVGCGVVAVALLGVCFQAVRRGPPVRPDGPATIEVAFYDARVGVCGPHGETGPVWEGDEPFASVRSALPPLESASIFAPGRAQMELLLLDRTAEGHVLQVEWRRAATRGRECPTTDPTFGVLLTVWRDQPFTIATPGRHDGPLAVVLRVPDGGG